MDLPFRRRRRRLPAGNRPRDPGGGSVAVHGPPDPPRAPPRARAAAGVPAPSIDHEDSEPEAEQVRRGRGDPQSPRARLDARTGEGGGPIQPLTSNPQPPTPHPQPPT